MGSYLGPVFYTGYSPKAIMGNLWPFINSYFGRDVITTYSSDETRSIIEGRDFDAFIVGSDQVWRPGFVPDIYHYYLDFLPTDSKVKRVAFCPSFGTDKWEYSMEQTKKCKDLISRFNAVAVREEGGVVLCGTYFDKEVTHLLDPTILYPKSKYKDVFVDEQKENKSKVASVYFLDHDLCKIAIVGKVCEILNLTPVYVNNRIQDNNARLRDRIAPSLNTWMTGFENSEFIVTDSFHATMFALYFNKPFITVINERRGAARFRSLMEELKLQERLVSSPDVVSDELIRGDIDWSRINCYIEQQRVESIKFLTNSLLVKK